MNKRWLLRLIVIILIMAIGFVGYLGYFNAENRTMDLQTQSESGTEAEPSEKRKSEPVLSAIYSTIQLFTMSYDETTEAEGWIIVLLDIARFAAILVAGTALGTIIIPLLSTPKYIHRLRKWKRCKKKVLLIGNNDDNERIAQSIDDTGKNAKRAIISDDTSTEDNQYVLPQAPDQLIQLMIEAVFQHPQAESYIIINTQNEEKNLCLCHNAVHTFLECLEKSEYKCDPNKAGEQEKQKYVSLLDRLRIIVFANIEQESIYLDLRRLARGVLQFCNEARNEALRYVLEHPLTEPLVKVKDIAGDNVTVADHMRFNVFLIGFGHINQQIYTVAAATNQFITGVENGIPGHNQVHYYAFDNRSASVAASLDNNCFRYRRVFPEGRDASAYLPLPERAADFTYVQTEIGSSDFFERIMDILKTDMKTDVKSFNTVIIATGDDLKNLDLAQQFTLRQHEEGLENLQIHCRVRNHEIKDAYNKLHRQDGIRILDEDSSNLDFDNIMKSELLQLAQRRNKAYVRINNQRLDADQLEVESMYQWYLMNPHKQESNLFDVLALRFKLNLLGLDFCREDQIPEGGKAITEAEYWQTYAGSHTPPGVDPMIAEPIDDFKKNNPRKNLTVQEHYRWNAYMISCGFVPASIAQIEAGDIKNYDLRYHGNLTTFDGLFDFRKIRMEKTGKEDYEVDVVKYDYQIMDDAWITLKEAGYVMYRKPDATVN